MKCTHQLIHHQEANRLEKDTKVIWCDVNSGLYIDSEGNVKNESDELISAKPISNEEQERIIKSEGGIILNDDDLKQLDKIPHNAYWESVKKGESMSEEKEHCDCCEEEDEE